jgi:hypothetical protein
MDEVKRFLRYTLPGMACIIELFVALSIQKTDRSIIINLFKLVQDIGLALSVFLGSGALGFLLSGIYFSLCWCPKLEKWFAYDYRPIFNELKSNLFLVDIQGEPYQPELTRREAWVLISQYWHSRIEYCKNIRGVSQIYDRLADVTHGLGATIIGSFLALITWLFLHHYHECLLIFILIFSCWIALIVLLYLNFKRSLNNLQTMAMTTLISSIKKEFDNKGKILIYYNPLNNNFFKRLKSN